jgi:hypothetical protein
MKTLTHVICAFLGFVAAPASGQERPSAEEKRPVVGIYLDGSVFAADRGPVFSLKTFRGDVKVAKSVFLWKCELKPKGLERLTKYEIFLPDVLASSGDLIHFMIYDRIIWGNLCNRGFDRVMRVPLRDIGAFSCKTKEYWEGRLAKDPETFAALCEGRAIQFDDFVEDLIQWKLGAPFSAPKGFPLRKLYGDFWLARDDLMLLFTLKDHVLQVWEARLKLTKRGADSRTAVAKRPLYTTKVSWDEPFWVFRAPEGKSFFFLTRGGRLYLWKDQNKATVDEVWIPGRRPVRTIVFDSSKRTAWAFTLHGDQGGKKRGVYFALREEREYANYHLPWGGDAQTPEPLLAVFRFAAFLKNEKKIGD